jgi:hypothetical protein
MLFTGQIFGMIRNGKGEKNELENAMKNEQKNRISCEKSAKFLSSQTTKREKSVGRSCIFER